MSQFDGQAPPRPVADDDSAKVMPLILGGGGPEGLPEVGADGELEALKPGSRLFNQGTLLLVGALLVAAGAVYAMRLSSQGDMKGGSADDRKAQAKVDEAIRRFGGAGDGQAGPHKDVADLLDPKTLAALFVADPTERQVPLQFVKQNPFVEQSAPVQAPTLAPGPQPVAAAPRNDPRPRLQLELKKLDLQSVVDGERPVAIVNGELLQPGQALGSFTVKEVSGRTRSVVLTAEGLDFTLSMEDPSKARGGPRAPLQTLNRMKD